MVDVNTVAGVISIIFALAIISLHVVVLTYIYKLERINCPCAEHPYRDYLKYYIMVSIVLLTANMFVPFLEPNATASGFIGFFLLLWVCATVVFYVLAIQYVRYLVKAKCACSEDVRRQVLYVWAILELCLIGVLFLLPLFIFAVMGALSLAVNTGKGFKSLPNRVIEQSTSPLRSLRKVPGSLRESLRKVSNRASKLVK